MDMMLNAKEAILCGWIINELVSNCFEHAFPDGVTMEEPPEVNVEMKVVKGRMLLGFNPDHKLTEGDKVELIVSDNGVGFPIDVFEAKMGAAIVKSLMKQLGAKMEIDHNNGTKFIIRFEI
jgi:two-component sensor histidine kinase